MRQLLIILVLGLSYANCSTTHTMRFEEGSCYIYAGELTEKVDHNVLHEFKIVKMFQNDLYLIEMNFSDDIMNTKEDYVQLLDRSEFDRIKCPR